jgi:hypothetical protein
VNVPSVHGFPRQPERTFPATPKHFGYGCTALENRGHGAVRSKSPLDFHLSYISLDHPLVEVGLAPRRSFKMTYRETAMGIIVKNINGTRSRALPGDR